MRSNTAKSEKPIFPDIIVIDDYAEEAWVIPGWVLPLILALIAIASAAVWWGLQ